MEDDLEPRRGTPERAARYGGQRSLDLTKFVNENV